MPDETTKQRSRAELPARDESHARVEPLAHDESLARGEAAGRGVQPGQGESSGQGELLGQTELLEHGELSLLETLDHVLNRGIVIAGEITISVADIDLLFLGLNVLLTSTETAREVLSSRGGNTTGGEDAEGTPLDAGEESPGAVESE